MYACLRASPADGARGSWGAAPAPSSAGLVPPAARRGGGGEPLLGGEGAELGAEVADEGLAGALLLDGVEGVGDERLCLVDVAARAHHVHDGPARGAVLHVHPAVGEVLELEYLRAEARR
jgi:hypothetical protein